MRRAICTDPGLCKISPTSLAKTLSAIAAAGLLGTALVYAADPNPPAPPRDRAAQPDRAGGAGRGGLGGMLDDQQRDLLREALQKHGDELRKLDEKMRVAQKELMQAIMAEKADEKVVREKAEVVAKIQVEQILLRAKALAVVVPTLKPEQREQLENSPWALGMMAGGFGGGRPMDRPVDPGQSRQQRGPGQRGADRPAR